VVSAAFSPKESMILTASKDSTARLWDVSTGNVIGTFKGHRCQLSSAAITPDETKVLTAGAYDDTMKLWNIATGAIVKKIRVYTGVLYQAALSPDGTLALTGSSDHSAKLWDVSTGACLRIFEGHASMVEEVAFSPDGTKVLVGSRDCTATLWDISDVKSTSIRSAAQSQTVRPEYCLKNRGVARCGKASIPFSNPAFFVCNARGQLMDYRSLSSPGALSVFILPPHAANGMYFFKSGASPDNRN